MSLGEPTQEEILDLWCEWRDMLESLHTFVLEDAVRLASTSLTRGAYLYELARRAQARGVA